MARSTMPRGKVDRRERVVLTDAELVVYLGWEHPSEANRMVVLQRQTMVCVSRCFGGLPTGDLHSLRWESLDVAGGFEFGWAPRKKTSRPQKLTIPAVLRRILRWPATLRSRPTRATSATPRGPRLARGGHASHRREQPASE